MGFSCGCSLDCCGCFSWLFPCCIYNTEIIDDAPSQVPASRDAFARAVNNDNERARVCDM